MNQEILVLTLYLMIVKEKLQEYLNGMKLTIGRDFRVNKADTEVKYAT